MSKAFGAAGAAEAAAPVRPRRNGSACDPFMEYVDMNLYGVGDNGAQRQNLAYPNPPVRMPAGGDDDGEHMTEYLRKRIDDMESGRAKMTTYTFDEYMRHLDEIWSG